MAGCAQIHVTVTARELQQEPDLLLSAVVPASLASYEAVGNFVSQPIPSACQDADMLSCQPHFLVEFSVHRLLGRFTVFYSSLRELP